MKPFCCGLPGELSREYRRVDRRIEDLIHNPVATVAMAEHWGVWDREFVTRADGDHWTATDVLAADST